MKHNMWGRVSDRQSFLEKAISLTGDHKKYGHFMRKVVANWKHSCEHNLTDRTQNQKAWIGHAACALAFGCPEDIVREAWGNLTSRQQRLANNEAANAIALWEGTSG